MTRGLRCFMLCMGILVICLIVDVIYTRQIAKKYEKSGNQRI